jgi:hypothetical protein
MAGPIPILQCSRCPRVPTWTKPNVSLHYPFLNAQPRPLLRLPPPPPPPFRTYAHAPHSSSPLSPTHARLLSMMNGPVPVATVAPSPQYPLATDTHAPLHAADDRPGPAPYRPAGHGAHSTPGPPSPPGDHLPAGQAMEVSLVAPEGQYRPGVATQPGVHSPRLGTVPVELYVPGGHRAVMVA